MIDTLHELCFTLLQAIRSNRYASTEKFRERQENCDIIVKDLKFGMLAEQSRGVSEKTYNHVLDLYSAFTIN